MDAEVVIVGAGFGGIATAIRLRKQGVEDFLLLEGADEVGGTWRVNTYPGIAVDVPSFQYQLSTDLNPDWSRVFAPGTELKAYAERVVDRHRLRDRIRFNARVASAAWNEDDDLWHVTLESGDEVTARYLISATGALSTAKMPEIPGAEDFQGKKIHTAKWDHDHNLDNERVAVIGTGATAVQLVPAIADQVARLDVYQRTPIWVLPKNDAPLGRLRHVFRRVPGAQRLTRMLFMAGIEVPFVLTSSFNKQAPQLTRAMERLGRRWIEQQVRGDKDLIEKLTPQYGFGCKRPSMSNDYLRSFTRDDVDLVTDPIERITPTGIRTRDGVEREIDTLIFATGYFTTEPGNLPTFPIAGAGGRDLNGFWMKERFQAYEGVSVPGYPNLFLTFGPYLVPGLSILTAIENAATHATRAIAEARKRKATRIEVRREPHERYFARMQRRAQNTVFFNNGCAGANSYYFDHHGDAPLLRPGGSLDAWWRAHRYSLDDYAFSNGAGHLDTNARPLAASTSK